MIWRFLCRPQSLWPRSPAGGAAAASLPLFVLYCVALLPREAAGARFDASAFVKLRANLAAERTTGKQAAVSAAADGVVAVGALAADGEATGDVDDSVEADIAAHAGGEEVYQHMVPSGGKGFGKKTGKYWAPNANAAAKGYGEGTPSARLKPSAIQSTGKGIHAKGVSKGMGRNLMGRTRAGYASTTALIKGKGKGTGGKPARAGAGIGGAGGGGGSGGRTPTAGVAPVHGGPTARGALNHAAGWHPVPHRAARLASPREAPGVEDAFGVTEE